MAENCLHKAYHHTLQCNCDELVVDLPFFLLLFFDCQENNEKKTSKSTKKILYFIQNFIPFDTFTHSENTLFGTLHLIFFGK